MRKAMIKVEEIRPFPKNGAKQMFAAYDTLSIYAVADTRAEAINKARADARDEEAQFETAVISTPLAYYIEANGWDGNSDSFEVVNGEIVNPEHRGQPIDPLSP
jgi:hypothetical protein